MTDFPEVKLKALPTFPAAVTAQSPVLLTRTNGGYDIALNEDQLRQDIGAPSIADVIAYTEAAQTSETNAAASAAAAAASASFLAASIPTYATRATAAAATISTSYTSIQIVRHTAGYQAAPAVYIPGTVSGPMAFQEAGGHYWELDLSGGVVDPRWFGAKGDGIADDTAALQAALTKAIGGKRLYIPPGNWGISSTLNGGAGNVCMFGVDNHRSVIQVLGTSALDPLLQFPDASDVTIDGVSFLGNNITVGVGAILFNATTGSGVMGRHYIRNCRFSNFKAWYWIRFLTSTGSALQTKTIRYVRVQNNAFFSLTGNAPDFASIGVSSNMIDIQGSVDNNTSLIDDVIISDNFADCGNVKVFASSWAGANNVLIKNNIVLNAGSAGQNDRGCYGILVYNNQGTADVTYSPTDITVADNTLIAPRSMGVYGATATRLHVMRNKISGVQDNTAASLPYAAISLGQCTDSKAYDNDLVDNYVSIQLIPTPASVTAEASRNRIRSSVNGASGVISTTLSSFINKVKISDNTILLNGTTTTGISCNSGGTGAEFDTVDIQDNRVSSTGTGISCLNNSGGGIKANVVRLFRNQIEGTFSAIGIEIEQSSAKILANDNTINMINAGASALGFKANNSTSIHIDGLQIANRATGSALAFSADGANGSMKNVNLIGIARANLPADGSTHMGFALPTVTATGIGQFIQNLATTSYTPQGSAGSQYTIDGWVFATGTTWYPRRCLTGT